MKRRVIYQEFAANALRKLDKKRATRIMGKVDYIAGVDGLPGVNLSGLPDKLKGLGDTGWATIEFYSGLRMIK